jgi:hypothetical protein
MTLPEDLAAQIVRFYQSSAFASRGGVVTDLDGTAVHEADGRITVAAPVTEALKALADLGRPVVLNSLRFPLNVIQTFGRAWSDITAEPLPLVSLNGAVVGLLCPAAAGDPIFDQVFSLPIPAEEIDQVIAGLAVLLRHGIDDVLLFHYAADWQQGEAIWTPQADRIAALKAKYRSASLVGSTPLASLRETLLSESACMLSVLVDIPEDRRMAYQHADPSRFVTAAGVDKLSGAREAAARFGFDLDQSVGAGDTPMDRFLAGVGLAFHVGPITLSDRGRLETIQLRGPAELGSALFMLAGLQRQDVNAGA